MPSIKSTILPIFTLIENIYLRIDKRLIRRTNNIQLIPDIRNRRGGKASYGEWCHVIGIFQTLMMNNLVGEDENTILDIGCGTGLLGIACIPLLKNGGKYIGIDVNEKDIEFCVNHYPTETHSFQHLDIFSPTYAAKQQQGKLRWNIPDNSIDLLTALSVWTHMNQDDACFYFQEINRVLKPGGRAIVTFFLLNDDYRASLPRRSADKGRFHNTNQMKWVFDISCSPSGFWFHPKWVKAPEDAVGITEKGLHLLMENTCLKVKQVFPGNWKELPGVYFQDVLIFEKS